MEETLKFNAYGFDEKFISIAGNNSTLKVFVCKLPEKVDKYGFVDLFFIDISP